MDKIKKEHINGMDFTTFSNLVEEITGTPLEEIYKDYLLRKDIEDEENNLE